MLQFMHVSSLQNLPKMFMPMISPVVPIPNTLCKIIRTIERLEQVPSRLTWVTGSGGGGGGGGGRSKSGCGGGGGKSSSNRPVMVT